MFCLSVVSAKLIRADPEVVQGHGFAAPPSGHHPHPQPPPRRPNRVKTISQFDKPGGFHPGANPYAGVELGPSTEQVFVSGPPLGRLSLVHKIRWKLRKTDHQQTLLCI